MGYIVHQNWKRPLLPNTPATITPSYPYVKSPLSVRILTHRGHAKRLQGCRRHFQAHFLQWRYFKFQIKFHWSLFRRVQLRISYLWFGAELARNHYPGHRFLWPSSLTQICITRPQWVKISVYKISLCHTQNCIARWRVH